ncbi:MAG: sulfatase-like hydrolase/transferase, partial [Verrucomicrobiota bacterium]|nr:sulfatase-like hydrolase/transferase [Verrucomicrobiota bacterium]
MNTTPPLVRTTFLLLIILNQVLGSDQRPNLIYVVCDDLGYGDLGCYGQKVIKTPRFDRMASEGLLFTDHYAGHTVCRPSRLVYLTGKHSGHTAIAGNNMHILPEGS